MAGCSAPRSAAKAGPEILVRRASAARQGRDGIGVEDITTEGYAFVVALSDGKTITFDLRSIFELYDAERGG